MEQRHIYGGVIAVVGLMLAGVQVIHGFAQFGELTGTDFGLAVLFDAVPFVALALALTYAGYWMTQAEKHEEDMPRIIAWAIGGTVAFASVAALMLFSQRITTGSLTRASYIAFDNITVGMLAGALVGLYDAQSQLRFRNLESERDRIEEFAQKAADINNYGRAISQSEGVEGISAFCLEAIATLLDVRETAFIEVTDDAMHVVGNTIVGTGSEALQPLVTETASQKPGEVVVHEDTLPADIGREVGTALTVHVNDRSDLSVVLIAVTDREDIVGEEDKQLLEMLVSHAAMKLDDIYELTHQADATAD